MRGTLTDMPRLHFIPFTPLVLIHALLLATAGCQTLEEEPVAPGDISDAVVEVTGTLRGGVMAIGAETTGYTLDLATGERVEVDVSNVPDAEDHADQPVRIRGHFEQREYVERGPTAVLVAREIHAMDQ